MRRHQPRVSNLAAGLIATVVILGVCYLVFGGSLPFRSSPFTLQAAFTVETQLHLGSPVRIAGVNVGTVTSVDRVSGSSSAAVATMTIQSNGLPIHADATADIRPRLFLEGNFYVDLHPGHAGSRRSSRSGDTLPASQTSGPVQLDRVLSALRSNTRADLQTVLQGFGASLNGRPTAAQDATQDPSVARADRGRGAQPVAALRRRRVQGVGDRQRGAAGPAAPRPVGRGHRHRAHVRGPGPSQSHLEHFVTSFNATMAALAARQHELVDDDLAAAADAARRRQRARPAAGLVRAHPGVRQAADPQRQADGADDHRRAAVAGAVRAAALALRARRPAATR